MKSRTCAARSTPEAGGSAAGRSIKKMKKPSAILLMLLFTVGCTTQSFHAPSKSMEPTIPEGSSVTIDFNAYRSSDPARFDIVAFNPPEPANADFIFRVLGLPGETISIQTNGIFINGHSLPLPVGLQYKPIDTEPSVKQLGLTEYYLLGDNTTVANDSRQYGPIERDRILGKVEEIEPAPPAGRGEAPRP